MSWTNECCMSNEFKVKNIDEVKRVIEDMGFVVYKTENTLQFFSSGEGTWFDDSAEVVFSIKPIKINAIEVNYIGLLSENSEFGLDELLENNNLNEDDVMVTPVTEYLQDQLIEGTGIVITTAGFEERCAGSSNPFGDCTIITKNKIEFISLSHWADLKVEELKVEV